MYRESNINNLYIYIPNYINCMYVCIYIHSYICRRPQRFARGQVRSRRWASCDAGAGRPDQYVCVYMYIHVYTCYHIYIAIYLYSFIYIYIYVVYISISLSIYIHIYILVYLPAAGLTSWARHCRPAPPSRRSSAAALTATFD